MKSFYSIKLVAAVLFCTAFTACVDDDNGTVNQKVDQSTFLQNSTSIIKSDYQTFNTNVNQLSAAVDSLSINPSASNFNLSQQALKAAYLAWQTVSFYDFGPAQAVTLKHNVNIYKTDTAKIERNISNADYNFDQFDVQDAIGFPAMDYLLNDSNSFNRMIADAKRVGYLKAIVQHLQTKVNTVANQWANEYGNNFSSKTGTDIGSGTGMLVNALNQHFEKYFRDHKLGVPLGIRSSGIAQPEFVEAAYGKYSLALAVKNLEAMKSFYLGRDGYGLDDYLKASDAEELNDLIVNQLNTIELKLKALNDPLQLQIETNTAQLQDVYNNMQRLIVYWKVDLPSRMGILITYQDNDGD